MRARLQRLSTFTNYVPYPTDAIPPMLLFYNVTNTGVSGSTSLSSKIPLEVSK